MKQFFLVLTLFFSLNFLVSCAISAQRAAQLTSWGERALIVATAFKAITPQDAAMVRNHGALILADLTLPNTPDRIAKISDRVVTFAEKKGDLTPAQADALREAGVVVLELTTATK
jgi:hypothetical protein